MHGPTSLSLWALACALAACTTGGHPAVPQVRNEAQRDLVCPKKDIVVRAEWGGRYRATGCGRTAVYHTACDHLNCTVGLEDEDAPAWRDRPDPGSVDDPNR